MKKILFLIMLLVAGMCSAMIAQDKESGASVKDTLVTAQKPVGNTALIKTPDVEMADTMRGSGKIYVVITTIAIIFVGLAIFLFAIERRVKKLEDQNKA